MKLEEKLLEYSHGNDYGFHMPGHKRQKEANPFLGMEIVPASIDITEIPGFDDLHEAEGILKEEMERAAAFYGTKATIFSVNGSTASNLAAISAAVNFGDHFLMAENCHRSVYHAASLLHLKSHILKPKNLTEDVPGPIEATDVKNALEQWPCSAVVITSPTYEGIVSDIASIAEIVHAHGAVLIVDEAHGAHLSRHPYFPASAINKGADLVIHSLHKTLPSLTQTSVLHNVTGRIPTEKLHEWMDVYESSSPSYILMASITSCIHTLEENGEAYFNPYALRLKACRERLKELKNLKLLDPNANGIKADPSKIVILTDPAKMDGKKLADILREDYRLVMEKVMPHYALAMTSCADSEEGFKRLEKALFEIDEMMGRTVNAI
jgi:arginine decarboxylase